MAQSKIIQGIVGGYAKSNIDRACQASSVNMFFDSQGAQSASSAIMRSIPGTSKALEMPEGKCRGLYRASRGVTGYPVLYGVWGSHLYLILQSNGRFVYHRIGTVSNGLEEPVSMCETNGYGDAHPRLIVADGIQLYAVDTTLQPPDQAADYKAIALPYTDASTTQYIKPSHVAYLYGYLAVLDQGTDAFVLSCQYPFEEDIYGDDIFMLEDHTYTEKVGGQTITVTKKGNPQGFKIYSEWCADTTRAMINCGGFLYTFGDRSFQCFSYHDDINFPFQSPDTAAAAIGIKAPRSIAAIGKTVFWLGASDIGENGIFMAEGTNFKRISTKDIEREIGEFVVPSDAVAQAWQEYNHVFYAITFRNDKRTFVYDLTEGLWHIRSSFDDDMPGNEGLWRPQYATLAYNKLFFGTLQDNVLAVQDMNKWTEYDGLLMVRKRISGVILTDFSSFYCTSLKLIINNGQVSDPDLLPEILMRYTWDGSVWSDQEAANVGPIGRYDWETVWWTLGYGEVLSVEVSCSDPYDFTIISAKIQYDQGGLL